MKKNKTEQDAIDSETRKQFPGMVSEEDTTSNILPGQIDPIGGDDDDLDRAQLDDTDDDGTPLNEKSSASDQSGRDLDVPGAEDDDDNEDLGEEDEENNEYSLPKQEDWSYNIEYFFRFVTVFEIEKRIWLHSAETFSQKQIVYAVRIQLAGHTYVQSCILKTT